MEDKPSKIDIFFSKVITLLFDHILTVSTIVAIGGIYVQFKHPEYLIQFTTAVNSWLLAKKD